MALATWIDSSRLLIVPDGTTPTFDSAGVRLDPPAGKNFSQRAEIEQRKEVFERIHPSKNLGVIFTVVLFIVILITNVPLRGLSSAIAISVILLITVVFAWLEVWERIFQWLGQLNIHMNMGFYVFFSTALLIAWILVTFVYDRMSYWRITPGEITLEYVFGGGQRSFQTEGMAFEKLRDDLFRHWVLGFGSGDMIMHPMQAGLANREDLAIHNVLFVGSKLRQIQSMIAARPDEPTVR
jgi:lysylphosphatidylglycerol synthetase-like protein (DUF2156 family)